MNDETESPNDTLININSPDDEYNGAELICNPIKVNQISSITSDDVITITGNMGSTCGSSPYNSGDFTITMADPYSVSNGIVWGVAGGGGSGTYSINTSASVLPIWSSANGTSTYADNSIVLGDSDQSKSKVYIVEPWQSNKPINIQEGLWVSLEKDLIPQKELKKKIMDKIEETHPDIAIKMGLNVNNIKLVKREITLEINKE